MSKRRMVSRQLRWLLKAVLPVPERAAPVALVTAPFGPLDTPSIQLGLLKAILAHHGIEATVYYLNLPFARLIDYDRYAFLSGFHAILLGEWIFSQADFGPTGDDTIFFREFPEAVKELKCLGLSRRDLLGLKRVVAPQYVEACVEMVPWHQHAIVGFTSTFQQNVASLAIARALKTRFPHITVVMGGANFSDEMGVECARAFPWIDYAVVGEGDEVFPQLVRQLLDGQPVRPQPGLVMRLRSSPETHGVEKQSATIPILANILGGPGGNGCVAYLGPSPMMKDLTSSPPPDYDEYFETGKRLNLFQKWQDAEYRRISLPFESSRGCWWGERSHCTFCGLNRETMTFRAKGAGKVLNELSSLSRRYEWSRFCAVDNILDRGFLHDLCTALSVGKIDLDIFYEVKANMNRTEVQQLRHAGIRRIQPGIESFSTHILALMKKGIKGIHNVELLKWARYYDVEVGWNILFGFPGEQIEDVTQQVEWVNAITHLPPPSRCDRIWLERFSPYYTQRDFYPVRNLRPRKSYAFVYPSDKVDLARIAYFFDYEMGETLPQEAWRPLQKAVSEWQAKWLGNRKVPSLTYKKVFDLIFISDNRFKSSPTIHKYSGPQADLYCLCETRRPLSECAKFLQERHGPGFSGEEFLENTVEEFIARRLMIRENDILLSLALPENRQW